MKPFRFIFALLIMSPVFSQSLQEAIRLALDNNPVIKASEQGLELAEKTALATSRKTLPKLEVGAKAAYISDVMELDLSTLKPGAGTISMGTNQSYGTDLTASYVLFSGYAQKASVQMSKKQCDIAAIDVAGTSREIAYNTAVTYRNIQRQLLKIAALESARNRADLQLQRVKALLSQGMALSIDTLSLSLAEMKFDQQLIALKAALVTTHEQLKNLTGSSITVSKTEMATDYPLPDLAINRLESLQSLSIHMDLIRQSEILARSKIYPSVAVQATFNFGKPGVDYIANEWMPYATVGIGMEWEIWNWGATKAETQAQHARIKQLRYQEENLRNQIQLRYNSVLRDYQSIRDQLKVFKNALTLAREKMRIIRLQSDKGLVSATDFNEANLELTRAEIDYQEHLIQLALKVLEIDYVSGSPISEWHFN